MEFNYMYHREGKHLNTDKHLLPTIRGIEFLDFN